MINNLLNQTNSRFKWKAVSIASKRDRRRIPEAKVEIKGWKPSPVPNSHFLKKDFITIQRMIFLTMNLFGTAKLYVNPLYQRILMLFWTHLWGINLKPKKILGTNLQRPIEKRKKIRRPKIERKVKRNYLIMKLSPRRRVVLAPKLYFPFKILGGNNIK